MAKKSQRAEDEFPPPKPQNPYPTPPDDVEPDTRKPSKASEYRKGGYVRAADGIAKRGKTRGTLVMCGGGRAK